MGQTGRVKTSKKRYPPRHVPLDRALSKLGLASRQQARTLIAEGRVRVDGAVAIRATLPVVPERARIEIDGDRARRADRIIVLLHKPAGVVTTRRDPEGRPTVYDLLTDLDAHVVPVGRLDFATSGLLLLTNDTRLADWIASPRSAVPRVYLVTVRGRVGPEACDRLVGGLDVDGERLAAAAAAVRKASGRESHLTVTLTGGRHREIRRLLLAVGHEVTRLRRVQVGGLGLGPLAPGRWRIVDDDELNAALPGWRAADGGGRTGFPPKKPRGARDAPKIDGSFR